MQTYGFSRITIQQLDSELEPVASKKHVVGGKPKEGTAASFEIAKLTKEPSRIFRSNIAYYVARKGHEDTAVSLGILNVPSAVRHEMLKHKKASEESKIYHIGEDAEPPCYAVLIEPEDLYGEKLGFGMYADAFSLDGVKDETLSGDDFTPGPGRYVYSAVSRRINGKRVAVGFAGNSEVLAELTAELFDEETPAPEK